MKREIMNNLPPGVTAKDIPGFDGKEDDGQWDCPECGDHCYNLAHPNEPIKDCFDHTEDGDMRKIARKLKKELESANRLIDFLHEEQWKAHLRFL